jgi:hypothetical protein
MHCLYNADDFTNGFVKISLGTTDPLGCHFCCLKKKVKRWKIKKGGI